MNQTTFKYMLVVVTIFLLRAVNVSADISMPLISKDELRQLREERDSAKAMLLFHGIRPYKYRVILRTNLYCGPHVVIGDEIIPGNALLMNTMLTINFNKVVSPRIGIGIGAGSFGFYFGGNVGVEKTFAYNHGISITPSLSTHIGVCGYSIVYPIIGVDATAELAFSHKRFSPYLIAGMRYDYIFSGYEGEKSLNTLLFPLGVGLSLKI